MVEIKKSNRFKEIIDENIRERLQAMGFSEPSSADQRSKGLAFLRFYLYKIFMEFTDVDEEEIESGIVDKANDLGIDFIGTIEDTVYIIQSKYGKSSVGKEELEHFVNLPDNLRNDKFIKKAHSDLYAILKEIRKIRRPTYHLIFITNTKLDEDSINYYENKKTISNTIINILSFTQLRQEYERVESLDDLPPELVVFNLGDEDVMELGKLNGEYDTILITQKGSKIKQIYNRKGFKESLFNYNVRFWLGKKNPVNSGMISTIEEEPQNFFYYNNGVTAVCDDFSLKNNNELHCTNLQIINGAQTIATIAKQPDTNLSDVKVLIRIVKGEKGKRTKDPEGLNEKIVKNNNSQTVIMLADFRSNDQIQKSMEFKSKDIEYTVNSPFKKVFYKRKRRGELPTATKVISKQDLGKAYYSFFYNPYDLNASIRRLWDTDSRGLYYLVFGEDGEPIESITQDKFIKMFGAYYIFEYIKKQMKGRNKNLEPVVLFKHHILWGIKQLLDIRYNTDDLQSILSSIVTSGKYVNEKVSTKDEDKFNKVLKKVTKIINLCINNEKKNRETFVIRNLQRDSNFVDTIGGNLRDLYSSEDIPDLF